MRRTGSLPEQFDWAGGARGESAPTRNPSGRPAYAMTQALRAKHRIFIHAGSIMERIEGDERIINTSVVFNRQGEESRATARSICSTDDPDGASYKESATVQAGRSGRDYDAKASRSAVRSATPALSRPFRALGGKKARRSSRCPPPSRCRPARTIGRSCCARARSKPRPILRERSDRLVHRRQRAAPDLRPSLVADPWGHVVAKASDESESSPPASIRRWCAKVRQMIPVAQHRSRFPMAAEPARPGANKSPGARPGRCSRGWGVRQNVKRSPTSDRCP